MNFIQVSNPIEETRIYNVSSPKTDLGFTKKMNIKVGDIIYESNSARGVFEILTMLNFVAAIVIFTAHQQYLSFISISYCVFYGSMVTALHYFDMNLPVLVFTLFCCTGIGGSCGYAVHLLELKNMREGTFMSIIVNVACFLGLLFIPADSVARFFMGMLAVINFFSTLICVCCKQRNLDPEVQHIHVLKMSESTIFATTLGAICLYSLTMSTSYTFIRYQDLKSQYPTNSEIGDVFGGILVSLIMVGIVATMSVMLMKRIPHNPAYRSKIPFVPTPGAAYASFGPQYF